MPNYKGSCHCRTVTYEIKTNVSFGAVCDCSICRRKGVLMGFAEVEDFKLLSGKEALTLYQFNTKAAKHYFCNKCGIYTHHYKRSDGKIAFNTGCIEGFHRNHFDEIKEIPGSTFSVEEEIS